jgi:RHS repeat-associated protein
MNKFSVKYIWFATLTALLLIGALCNISYASHLDFKKPWRWVIGPNGEFNGGAENFEWEIYTPQNTNMSVSIHEYNNYAGEGGLNPVNGGLLLNQSVFGAEYFYNSKNIWEQVPKKFLSGQYDTYYVHLQPSGNLGQGWDLHMGKIYESEDSVTSPYYLIYEEPSGVKHGLDYLSGYGKSNDGSYLRYIEWDKLFLKDGNKLDFTEVVNYGNTKQGLVLSANGKIDNNGNISRIYYGEIDLKNLIDSIVSPVGEKTCFYYSFKIYRSGTDSIVLYDSISSVGYQGSVNTIRFKYNLYKTTTQPFNDAVTSIFDEGKWSKVALSDTIRRYCLKSIHYPNGDSVVYDYNSYFELTRITNASGGKTEYVYNDLKYGMLDVNNSYTRKTRAIDTVMTKDANSNILSLNYYNRHNASDSSFCSNSDSVLIGDIYGNETLKLYHYTYPPFKWEFGFNYKKVTYDGPCNHGAGIVIDSTRYITTSDSIYNGVAQPFGKNMRTDSLVHYVGTKKYLIRYRQYDNYSNPQRIDYTGDMSTTLDNYSVFTEYLHNSNSNYNDSNRHILNLPIRTYVKQDSASGAILSEIKYFYDDTSRIDTTAYGSYPPHKWVSPGLLRGNITRTCRWKAGSLFDTTQTYYDIFGNVIKSVDAKGDSAKIKYDPTGDPDKYYYAWPWKSISYVSINGSVDTLCTTTEYDTYTGLPINITDANGQSTEYLYDAYGRIRKVARPGDDTANPSAIRHYYDSGSPRSVVDSMKLSGTDYLVGCSIYDDFGRVKQSQKRDTDGKSIIINTAYDSLSRVRKVSNPIKTSTNFGTYVSPSFSTCRTFYYDALSRPLKTVYQDGNRDSIVYADNRVTTFDGLNHSSTAINNTFGSPDTVIDGLGNYTITKYDRLGRDTSITDAEGKTTKCYYDTLGRLRGFDGPDASSSYSYLGKYVDQLTEYDAVDNVTWCKTDKGAINYIYDALSRVTEVDSASSSYPKVMYLYDTYTNSGYSTPPDSLNNARGRLTRLVTVDVDTTWMVYDKLGLVRKKIFAYAGMGGGRDSVIFHYNSADACTSITYPDGSRISYAYNTAGRLTEVPGYVSSVTYNAAGLPTDIYHTSHNMTDLFTYDTRLRPTYITAKDGNLVFQLKLQYTYWQDGNIKKIQDYVNSDFTQYYDYTTPDSSYDALGRLKRCAVGSTLLTYTYDKVGNRTQETIGGTTNSLSYTSGTNRLSSANISGTTYNYSYDNSGNILTKSMNMFTHNYYYNFNNMLYKMNIMDSRDGLVRTVTNYYGNGGSVRVKKTDSETGSRYYAYNGIDPICEYDSTGTIKKKYVYAFGRCIGMIDSAGRRYLYEHDQVGSIRLVVDTTGTVINSYAYYPFGDSLSCSGTLVNDLQFGGKPNVAGIDAYDFSARYYDPAIGRFYSIDPIYRPATSPYVYCNNNPVNMVDPTGMNGQPTDYYYPIYDVEGIKTGWGVFPAPPAPNIDIRPHSNPYDYDSYSLGSGAPGDATCNYSGPGGGASISIITNNTPMNHMLIDRFIGGLGVGRDDYYVKKAEMLHPWAPPAPQKPSRATMGPQPSARVKKLLYGSEPIGFKQRTINDLKNIEKVVNNAGEYVNRAGANSGNYKTLWGAVLDIGVTQIINMFQEGSRPGTPLNKEINRIDSMTTKIPIMILPL